MIFYSWIIRLSKQNSLPPHSPKSDSIEKENKNLYRMIQRFRDRLKLFSGFNLKPEKRISQSNQN